MEERRNHNEHSQTNWAGKGRYGARKGQALYSFSPGVRFPWHVGRIRFVHSALLYPASCVGFRTGLARASTAGRRLALEAGLREGVGVGVGGWGGGEAVSWATWSRLPPSISNLLVYKPLGSFRAPFNCWLFLDLSFFYLTSCSSLLSNLLLQWELLSNFPWGLLYYGVYSYVPIHKRYLLLIN